MGKYLRDGDEPAVEIQPLTGEEVQPLLETAAARAPVFYPFLLAALRTGMRLGELLALEWRDLDFDARVIHVRRARVGGRVTTTKNKTRRRVDMSLKLAEELRRLRRRHRVDPTQRTAVGSHRDVPPVVRPGHPG